MTVKPDDTGIGAFQTGMRRCLTACRLVTLFKCSGDGAPSHLMKVVQAPWPAIRAMLMERPVPKGDATCVSGDNAEARYSGALAGTISLTEQQRRPVRLDTYSTISQPARPLGQITDALATTPRLQPFQECGLPDLERASTGMVGAAESLHMARMMRMQQP